MRPDPLVPPEVIGVSARLVVGGWAVEAVSRMLGPSATAAFASVESVAGASVEVSP
ncbi:hypothetical protein D3C72_730370 [compost metagenome]